MERRYKACILSVNRLVDSFTIALERRSVCRVIDALLDGSSAEDVRAVSSKCRSADIRRIADAVLNLRTHITSLELPSTRRISVVVPHYNHHNFLSDALQSLVMQTVSPHEVIIIDDASDDRKCLELLVDKFSTKLPLHLVINQKRLSAGQSRQIGADLASGEVLVMHDADDISHPQRLEITQKIFLKYPTACQLNLGFWRFENDKPSRYCIFRSKDVDSHTVHLSEIDQAMRIILSEQRLSIRKMYGTRFGGYGTVAPRSVSSGHVAYLRCLAPVIRWPSQSRFVFTTYEDYEFNTLLYLAARSSYEVTLPLIGYREGSTTNRSPMFRD